MNLPKHTTKELDRLEELLVSKGFTDTYVNTLEEALLNKLGNRPAVTSSSNQDGQRKAKEDMESRRSEMSLGELLKERMVVEKPMSGDISKKEQFFRKIEERKGKLRRRERERLVSAMTQSGFIQAFDNDAWVGVSDSSAGCTPLEVFSGDAKDWVQRDATETLRAKAWYGIVADDAYPFATSRDLIPALAALGRDPFFLFITFPRFTKGGFLSGWQWSLKLCRYPMIYDVDVSSSVGTIPTRLSASES